MKRAAMILVVLFLAVGVSSAASIPLGGEVTFAWDANNEDDLKGYKIYYGKTSRFAVEAPEKIINDLVIKNCGTNPESNSYKECKESWEVFCKCVVIVDGECIPVDSVDMLCDYDFYTYDAVVDVGNVLEYTLNYLADGHYYFAATAYDEDGNESKFSLELDINIDSTAPNLLINFSGKMKNRTTYKIIIEEIEITN